MGGKVRARPFEVWAAGWAYSHRFEWAAAFKYQDRAVERARDIMRRSTHPKTPFFSRVREVRVTGPGEALVFRLWEEPGELGHVREEDRRP